MTNVPNDMTKGIYTSVAHRGMVVYMDHMLVMDVVMDVVMLTAMVALLLLAKHGR